MVEGVFFSYFGAKYMRGLHYPKPEFDMIIEPFAGAAGYSVRHYTHKVHLIDTSPYIIGVWDYLIGASPKEILRLPLMEVGDDVQDLCIPQEAKWLIGFWINQGSSAPKRTMGGRASNSRFGTWGQPAKERLSRQVELIRHWKTRVGDYRDVMDHKATWFIDPPYQDQGKQYQNQIDDYAGLAEWCETRKGQVIVCESEGADWLPFEPVTSVTGSSHRTTTEVMWYNSGKE